MKPRRTCLLVCETSVDPVSDAVIHQLADKEQLELMGCVPEEAVKLASERKPSLLLFVLRGKGDQLLLQDLIERIAPSPVLILDAQPDYQSVLAVLRLGAVDYFALPLDDAYAFIQSGKRQLYHSKLFSDSQFYRDELEHSLAVLQEDQQAGHHVQQRVLPPNHKQINDYQFDYCLKPSLYLSGDYVDYFRISESLSMFYLADISGHGASSAFVTVLLKNMSNRLLRNYIRGSSFDILSPTDVLARINKELLDTGLGKHLTIFVGLLDRIENTLQYGVGGHFPMPILTQNGETKFLNGGGMAVGLFDDAQFDGRIVELADDFQLHIFSDGILEVMEADNLSEKESMLLAACAKRYDCVTDLLTSLGADDVDEAPDDIAVLSVSRVV